MKMKDFTVYNQCLEYSTPFEIEEISKAIPEIEDKFLKFLRYVEILNNKDQKRIEGQKLISMIFSIEKYKAYQNMSLQLFD